MTFGMRGPFVEIDDPEDTSVSYVLPDKVRPQCGTCRTAMKDERVAGPHSHNDLLTGKKGGRK